VNTAIWTCVLLLSGLIDAMIGVWALKRAETVGGVFSREFVLFAILGSFVFSASIVLYLASMVGAPSHAGFIFIWPVSVVFFSALLLAIRGEIDLAAWQWVTGSALAISSLVFWSWVGEGA